MTQTAIKSEERKPCRYCAEQIRPEARLCPFCGSTLRNAIYLSLDFPATVVTVLTALATLWFVQKHLISKRDFSKYRDQLVVLHSSLLPTTKKGIPLEMVGIVTNRTTHAWDEMNFEVRFYDAKGEMVDSLESRGFFTLQSHSDHSFKLSLDRFVMRTNYISHRVFVCGAKQPPTFW